MFGPMVLVALPEGVVSSHQQPHSYAHAEALQNTLYHQYSIEVCVCVCMRVCFRLSTQVPVKVIQDRLYVRISSHIYNTARDYMQLASAIINIKKQRHS